MVRALIGASGFVGSNLRRQASFDYCFTSVNIEEIRGQTFDLVACAAPSSVKWRANKYPEQDLASVERLMACLLEVRAGKFILFSSIDVYPVVDKVNEDSQIYLADLSPYSRHRRMLEVFVADNFDALVIRLPGIFGPGLKKNIIYDLLHGNSQFIHQDGVLQYYCLDCLWMDVQLALAHNLPVLNLATEPTAVREVAAAGFGIHFDNNVGGPPPRYDMHSKYGQLWGKSGPYLYEKARVLADLKRFVKVARAAIS